MTQLIAKRFRLWTKRGQKIVLDSSSGSEKIEIVDKSGQKFVLDSTSGSEKIQVIDKSGRSSIIMDAAQSSVSIESAMDLSIKATGKIQIEGQMGVSINTSGGNLELKSNAQTTIEGTLTSVQGTATAELKSGGGGKVVVLGPQVMLN